MNDIMKGRMDSPELDMTLAATAGVISIFRGMKISEVKIMFLCYT